MPVQTPPTGKREREETAGLVRTPPGSAQNTHPYILLVFVHRHVLVTSVIADFILKIERLESHPLFLLGGEREGRPFHSRWVPCREETALTRQTPISHCSLLANEGAARRFSPGSVQHEYVLTEAASPRAPELAVGGDRRRQGSLSAPAPLIRERRKGRRLFLIHTSCFKSSSC